MPSTINAGASSTIALAAGEYLVLDGIGTAQVVSAMPPNVDVSVRRFSVGATVGPFDVAASVRVVAGSQGAVSVDVDGPGGSDDGVIDRDEAAAIKWFATGGASSGGLPVMLVGDSNTAFGWDSGPACSAITDNGDGTATISFASSHNWAVGGRITVNSAPESKFNRFSALVTAQVNTNPHTVTYQLDGRSSPVVGATAANTQTLHMGRYSPIGFAPWLEAVSGRRLGYLLAAAGGADSSQALAIYNEAIPEARAALCSDLVLMIGTNDIFARGWDFATVQASIKALADRIRATFPGRIWWVVPPPMGSGAAAWSAGKQTVLNRVVRWIWRYAAQIGATPIDSWRGTQNGLTFVNPAASNPDHSANFLGADATHTTNLGALCIARAIAQQWAVVHPALGLGFQGGHGAVQSQGNALANSRLTGAAGTKTPGGGTIAGTVPDSWTVEITSGTGTLTLSSPARTVASDGDADGNELVAVVSGSALTWRLMNTASIHASVSAGQVRDVYVPVSIAGAAGLAGVELILFGGKSSGGNENLGMTGVSQAITGDINLCLRMPRVLIPAGLTSLSMFVRFTGATAGTFVIGKPCVELVE